MTDKGVSALYDKAPVYKHYYFGWDRKSTGKKSEGAAPASGLVIDVRKLVVFDFQG
jgi:hypothetical protein